jgi:CopG-like RHH_1 or ribbon-helix-helix domain, RHH_5
VTDYQGDDMAKKTTAQGGDTMPAATEEAALMLVRLELPKDVHKQFRVEAAKEGVSMARMARTLVEEWVAERQAGGSK